MKTLNEIVKLLVDNPTDKKVIDQVYTWSASLYETNPVEAMSPYQVMPLCDLKVGGGAYCDHLVALCKFAKVNKDREDLAGFLINVRDRLTGPDQDRSILVDTIKRAAQSLTELGMPPNPDVLKESLRTAKFP